MLNRRLIRVKVFKELFGRVVQGNDSLMQAEKELILSCNKTVDLYCLLLGLPSAIKKVAQARIDAGLKKFQPTAAEANPNMKFVENKFIEILENDSSFNHTCQTKGLGWAEYDTFIKKLFASIVSKDYYTAYMENPERSLKEDMDLVKRIYEEELEDNELLEDILEEMSLYWMDDLSYVINVILKNIPAYESATQQIEQSSKKWEKEISALNTEIQKLYKNYQSEMVLLSDEQKKERAQEIVDKETEVKDLKRKYFGNDGELYKKRESLMKPIQEEIYNAIKDIAEAKKYMRVDDRASSASILFANPAVDISDEVLAKLGYAK